MASPTPAPDGRTPSAPPPLLAPASRAELRAWLAENHATSRGVHLAVGKKGNTVTTLTYDDAVEEGLAFGWIDSVAHRLDEDRYTVLYTPRKRGSVWAKTNKARVARLTEDGLMTAAGLAVVEAAKADGSWDLLTDADDLVMPSDFAAALEASSARPAFERLTVPERQRTLFWIGSAKRPETRARRISDAVVAVIEGRSPA